MIIVRVPNWIGDAVISRGFLKALMKKFDRKIFVIGKEFLRDIFYDFEFKGFKTYKEYFEILKSLKDKGFNEIYILPFSFSSAFFPFFVGIKIRIGFESDRRGFLLTHKLPPFYIKREHLLKSFLRLIDMEESYTLYYPELKRFSDRERKNTVIIAPHATYGKAKEWVFFKELSEYLLKEKFEVIVIGRKKIGEYPEGVIDLRGKTDLKDVLKIISEAEYVFSNDSGIAHIAGSMGKKVFVFFGSTSPLWTKPLGKNVYIFYKKVFCSPCFERTCKYNTYDCMKKITIYEVEKFFSIVK
ncbi:MAG: glycosyltransferase family 9 protein [candidate division WOR-3 bacterium]